MRRVLAVIPLGLALVVAAPAQADYHSCPGTVPYAGYENDPGFWWKIEAKRTPCKAAKRLVREATYRWSQKPTRINVGKVIYVNASVAGGATYRCRFHWVQVNEIEFVGKAKCKARGGKRIRFQSVKAGH